MSRRIHVAHYTSEQRLLGAVKGCRDAGLHVLDVRSPYPIHGLDELVGIPRSRLPIACLVGGVTGLGLATWFQYWTSATDWPIDVGGKPFDSLPAFAPVAFEVTILLAGLATVFGLLFRTTRLRAEIPEDELRVTDDRFVLVAVRPDADVSDAALARLWIATEAVHTSEYVEDER